VNSTLHEFNSPPEGFLHCPALDLYRLLPGPSLLHWPGPGPTLFVSILLHGNEDAGLKAVQGLLLKYQGRALPRAMSVFVGNVHAAAAGVRHLSEQPDFNRIWARSDAHVSPYHQMAAQVLQRMQQQPLFAVLDLHNNSGRNPLYSCVSSSQAKHRPLAALFSPIVVQVDGLRSLNETFSSLAPSICCECGEIGNQAGVQRALELLEFCLTMSADALGSVDHSGLQMLQAYAEIHVPASATIGFDENQADVDLCLSPDIDLLNFLHLPQGQVLAQAGQHTLQVPLVARNVNDGQILDLFVRDARQIRLKEAAMAAMLTPSVAAIRQTCLGYLMRPVASIT
jgi:Succinylglutamate desuccinylase / Aspartoacylase family